MFFVDYGDTRSVSVSEVRPLRPEHCSLAGQAVRCCSAEAGRAARTSWSEQEVSFDLIYPQTHSCGQDILGRRVGILRSVLDLESKIISKCSTKSETRSRNVTKTFYFKG